MIETIQKLSVEIEAMRRAYNRAADDAERALLDRKRARVSRSLARALADADLTSCLTPGEDQAVLDLYPHDADLETAEPTARILITAADCAAANVEAL